MLKEYGLNYSTFYTLDDKHEIIEDHIENSKDEIKFKECKGKNFLLN